MIYKLINFVSACSALFLDIACQIYSSAIIAVVLMCLLALVMMQPVFVTGIL